MLKFSKLKDIIIVLFSTVLTFAIWEFGYRAFKKREIKTEGFIDRTMLFEAGENFENHKGFFKYYPNVSIRSLTLFSKPKPKSILDLKVEYDYVIKTNNAGLVMQKDLKNKDKVFYIIGDSFTEGQGASPWFYEMENDLAISDIKLINLGLLSTGPIQWENLSSTLKKEFSLDVKGSVINIIPEDMKRTVRSFHPRELRCLKEIQCDYLLGFQGFRFHKNMTYKDIKSSVLNKLKKQKGMNKSFTIFLKDLLKKSYIVSNIYYYFSNSPEKINVKSNEIALLKLKDAVKDKIFINVVSQKSINSKNYLNYNIARNLIFFLKENNFNYTWCDIDVEDFHKYDGHPNKKGYETLRKCTENALKTIMN